MKTNKGWVELLHKPEPGRSVLGRLLVRDIINRYLDERSRFIIESRYGLEGEVYTIDELARIFRTTKEKVRQIEGRAMTIIRQRYERYL